MEMDSGWWWRGTTAFTVRHTGLSYPLPAVWPETNFLAPSEPIKICPCKAILTGPLPVWHLLLHLPFSFCPSHFGPGCVLSTQTCCRPRAFALADCSLCNAFLSASTWLASSLFISPHSNVPFSWHLLCLEIASPPPSPPPHSLSLISYFIFLLSIHQLVTFCVMISLFTCLWSVSPHYNHSSITKDFVCFVIDVVYHLEYGHQVGRSVEWVGGQGPHPFFLICQWGFRVPSWPWGCEDEMGWCQQCVFPLPAGAGNIWSPPCSACRVSFTPTTSSPGNRFH